MRDKQIEELAALLKNCLFCEVRYNYQYNFVETIFDYEDIAETIIEEGYRKTSEIFEESEKSIANLEYKVNTPRKTVKVEELKAQVNWILHEVVPNTIAELKKKYESEGEG